MNITVRSPNLTLPERVKDETAVRLERVRKLFDRIIDVDVTISEENTSNTDDRMHCEIALRAKGRVLRASATAGDPIAAVDAAERKLETQLRRLKSRLTDRSQGRGSRRAAASIASDGHP